MSDDTQDANHEPGDPKINLEAAGLPGIPSPYPPSGICLVGDGLSWSSTTRPNAEPIIGGLDNVRHARILGLCEQLRDNPWKLERIETLLGILVTDPSVRERLGAIAVKLGSSPGLIENAEQLIAMGS